MTHEELLGYAVTVCGHARSKRICGRVLNTFTTHLNFVDAAAFVKEVIAHGDSSAPPLL